MSGTVRGINHAKGLRKGRSGAERTKEGTPNALSDTDEAVKERLRQMGSHFGIEIDPDLSVEETGDLLEAALNNQMIPPDPIEDDDPTDEPPEDEEEG